ncbi:uncharacterized mitochondrial protein AtMg00810-like [Humulus lupulus]|uniref:uncharacterized mitochondrial protein AtMg00810-like n=1 Tax=Humulus lupulus TaxID=3486 RepID=UPI002B41603D|nr:uncharacterized mitochondrial protein AtMg00810-like [Humulus lupulus]
MALLMKKSTCINQLGDALVFVLVYVDDILLIGNKSQQVTSIISQLSTTFALKTLVSVHYFLGFETTRRANGIYLSQTKYTIDLLKHTNMLHAKPCPTPINQSNSLHLQDSKPFEHITLYRSIIGALQYLTLSRPDIAFTVKKLNQFLQAPTQNHWQACKKILRYLAGTVGEGIKFTPAQNLSIESFCDSDWANSLDDHKSTSGYCVYLSGNLINWSSRKQKPVACSSTEVEYRALAQAYTEIIWLQSLLKEIGTAIPHQPSFGVTIQELDNWLPTLEKVSNKEVEVRYVPSSEQTADILTKSLSIASFHYLQSKLAVVPSPQHNLRGHIETEQSEQSEIAPRSIEAAQAEEAHE